MATNNGISRRMMLATAGGVAGATALGVRPAFGAADDAGSLQGAAAFGNEAAYTPGALTPGLQYQYYSAYQFFPNFAADNYSVDNGRFRYLAAPGGLGYASVPLQLPTGAVIKEIEFYGNRIGAGAVLCELWRSGAPTAPGSAVLVTSAAAPAPNTDFTVKLTVDQPVTNQTEVLPFVSIPGTFAQFYGIRVGYTGPSDLYLLATPVRAHDSRTTNGGPGPIPSGTTRTISLASAIPTSAVGALMTLTLDNTVGSGFLSLFSAALASTTTSSVNWYQDGQVLANSVTSAVSGQSVKVFCGNGSTNFLIDVLGYYQ